MSVTNRSGLQCIEHPNQQITNFCLYANCLKPLCPDCVQIHTKFHEVQQIQSWKHCINKSAKGVKSTLQTLKTIYQQQNKYRPFKNLQTVQNQNIKRLYQMKEKVHKLVDQIFTNQQQHVRMFIRNQYKIDQPDTTKLKQAIQEMEKLLMKLAHSGTVLSALKKAILLDHQSLLNYFGDMQVKEYKPINQNFFLQNHEIYPQIKNILQNSLSVREFKQNNTIYNKKQIALNGNYTSPVYNKNQSFESEANKNVFQSLKITVRNYFTPLTKYKLLHFFIPASNQLKTLQIQSAQKGNYNWKSVLFSGKSQLPCYFKSIITPEGQIYLTGGSQGNGIKILDQKRCKEIYKYNYEKNSLDLVCKMTHPRSSHSICYANGLIYLIGGFSDSDGQVTRSCQVFNPRDKTCIQIAPLNTPSANSCATTFNDQFIFKFGGVLNKIEGNSLIQMYSIKINKWIVVDIQKDKNIPTLQLLSFSAAVQINDSQIIIFGGYDNSETQRPQRLCYTLQINTNKRSVRVKNYNLTPLAYAQGFWNNNPIIHQSKVYALQNITDQQDQLTAIADERRVIIFNGDRWL